MEEIFINFETAKLAKEKGFSKTYKCYSDTGGNAVVSVAFQKVRSNEKKILYPKPTQTILQKWLRENHKISIITKQYYSGKFTFEILKWDSNSTIWIKVTGFMEKTFYSFEEALEEGLIQGLELIEDNEK